MSRLVPLADIPAVARSAERTARAAFSSRAAALAAAKYEIVQAPGAHSRPSFDPPSVGWVVTRAAADAVAAELVRMPGGTSHRHLAVRT